MTTISGAYGRDYKSKKGVLEDWNSGKDFAVRDMFTGGAYVNRQDAEDTLGIFNPDFNVRYNADRSICVIAYSTTRKTWVTR